MGNDIVYLLTFKTHDSRLVRVCLSIEKNKLPKDFIGYERIGENEEFLVSFFQDLGGLDELVNVEQILDCRVV